MKYISKFINKLKVVWAHSIAVVLVLIISFVCIFNAYDNKDDSKSVALLEEKSIIMQLGTFPNNGVYPNERNHIYIQIEELISDMAERFSMEPWQVRVIYRMMKLNPVYTDKAPNIYTDLSVTELVEQDKYTIESYQKDSSYITEPSNKRLADVVYSVMKNFDTFEIENTLTNEGIINGIEVRYLSEKDKGYIKFALNVLDFFGQGEHKETFCADYKRIISLIVSDDISTKTLYLDSNKNAQFNTLVAKELFGDTYNEEYVSMLANILSGNDALINNGSFLNAEYASGVVGYPYKYMYFSRANMMRAAISVVGKVRYIWSGGHGGGSNIAGINPMWERFNDVYKQNSPSSSIKNSGTWCPIHGSAGNCAYRGNSVKTVDQYIDYFNSNLSNNGYGQYTYGIDRQEVYNVFNGRGTVATYSSQALNPHSLDGLDCSGFACWLYNQVDGSSVKDTVASSFASCAGMRRLKFGEQLYPGDAVGWDTHIIIIFGQYSKDCYITVEQTPDELKFGACSFNGGSARLNEAKAYADKLNDKFGVTDGEGANSFNFNNYTGRGLGISRSARKYIDEGKKIDKYGRSFEHLNATEILEVLGYAE